MGQLLSRGGAGALLAGCLLSLAVAAPAVSGIPAKAKCPVCGMLVARYPDWLATLTFRDGKVLYFDGPRDLFTAWFDPARHLPGRQLREVTAVTVSEYYSLKPLDARQAWYVIGSDVKGPMGSELLPFASAADAEAFRRDHRGTRVLRFRDITPSLVGSLP